MCDVCLTEGFQLQLSIARHFQAAIKLGYVEIQKGFVYNLKYNLEIRIQPLDSNLFVNLWIEENNSELEVKFILITTYCLL